MFYAIFATIVVVLLGYQLHRIRSKPGLRQIPGPFIASFTNFWKINAVFRGDMPQRNIEVHQKYGPVVRIGPNHVSFKTLAAMRTIYNSRQQFPKSDFYKPVSPVFDGTRLHNLFSAQDIEYHARLKRTISGLFTTSAVSSLEHVIDSNIELFVHQMMVRTDKGTCSVDMSLWPHLFAFDTIGTLTLSRRFGFLETGTDVRNMIKTADRIYDMTGLFGQSPLLQEISMRIKAIWTKTKPNPILALAVADVHDRISNKIQRGDMLDGLLDIHKSSPDQLSVNEVVGAIYINLMAGHDVLAITLRTLFYHLARRGDIRARVRAELSELETHHPLPSHIPYRELAKLPYLDAVLYEALRIHANTGVMLERVVPASGFSIDGYWLPRGTIVGVNGWVMHCNEEIFGADVDKFKPERWLDLSEETLSEMKRHIFSFGAGSRRCIGYNFAMTLSAKLIVEFVRRFDMTLVDPNKSWHIHGSWVTKQTEMDMEISRHI